MTYNMIADIQVNDAVSKVAVNSGSAKTIRHDHVEDSVLVQVIFTATRRL